MVPPAPAFMELFYKQYGAGPPLLILHGLLGASGNGHSLSSGIFAEHFTVYALDQRNHGRSPHDDVFTYEAMADDVRVFIETHGLEQPHVLGHSMGGKTAMQLALSHPDHLGSLIVVDIAPRAYPPHHRPLLAALAALDLDALASRKAIDDALAERVSSAGVRQFLLKNLDYDRETGRYSWKMNLPVIARTYEQVNVAMAAEAPYTGPARFIRGATSDYIRDADFDDIRSLFPHADVVTIDGAGHWVHADKPRALAEAVLDFLGE